MLTEIITFGEPSKKNKIKDNIFFSDPRYVFYSINSLPRNNTVELNQNYITLGLYASD